MEVIVVDVRDLDFRLAKWECWLPDPVAFGVVLEGGMERIAVLSKEFVLLRKVVAMEGNMLHIAVLVK